MKDRRIGRFSIPGNLIDERPDEIRAMLAGVIVVRAEQRWDYDGGIDYIGLCDAFDQVLPGDRIPEYTVTMRKDWEEGKPPRFTVEEWRRL